MFKYVWNTFYHHHYLILKHIPMNILIRVQKIFYLEVILDKYNDIYPYVK